MASVSAVKALAGYFNVEPRKVPLSEFTKEIKALSPEEKQELAEGVCAITGDTLLTSSK